MRDPDRGSGSRGDPPKCVLRAVLALLLGVAAFLPGAFAAESVLTARDAVAVPHTFPVETSGLDVVLRNIPAEAGSDVVRGALRTGTGPGDYAAFVWDRTRSVLYLDRNGNADLGDDPDGTYKGATSGMGQIFTGITLVRDRGGVPVTYRFLLTCLGAGRITATVQNGWTGTVEVGGRPFEFTWVDNLNGVPDEGDLLTMVSPDAEPDAGSSVDMPPPEFLAVPPAKILCIDGVSISFLGTFRAGAVGADLAVDTTPVDMPSGTLVLGGEIPGRLILRGEGVTLVLTGKPRDIRVPAATYAGGAVYLDGGGKTLRFKADLEQDIRVTESGTTDLLVGGPLRNTARTRVTDTAVRFDYELHGVGGELYKALVNDYAKPPELTVFRGDNKVHNGNFEYG